MIEFLSLLTGAFFIGLAAQTHCVGMCGPVIGILGMNNSYKRIPAAILYNLGRISTYTLLGVVGGLIAASVSNISSIQYVIRYIAGGIMILIALQLFGMPQALGFIERPFQYIWKPIQRFSQRFFPIRTARGTYTVGMIWGLLPCGAVYGPLAVAIGAGSVAKSAGIMFAFGLGTLPIMLGLAIFGNFVGHFFAKKKVRMVAGVMVLIMAIYYLGWIAPQAQVSKRAATLSGQTEQIRTGEKSAIGMLEEMKNSGHAHGHGNEHSHSSNHDATNDSPTADKSSQSQKAHESHQSHEQHRPNEAMMNHGEHPPQETKPKTSLEMQH